VAVDVEAEDVARLLLGVVRVLGQLHAAGLSASAGQHLRLDDDLASDLLGNRARLRRRGREPSLRHRNAEAREELLALVLVQVHRGVSLLTPLRVAQCYNPPTLALPDS